MPSSRVLLVEPRRAVAELEPAARRVVDRDRLGREHRRVAIGHAGHEQAEPHAFGERRSARRASCCLRSTRPGPRRTSVGSGRSPRRRRSRAPRRSARVTRPPTTASAAARYRVRTACPRCYHAPGDACRAGYGRTPRAGRPDLRHARQPDRARRRARRHRRDRRRRRALGARRHRRDGPRSGRPARAHSHALPAMTALRGNTDRYVVTGERPPPSIADAAADPELVPVVAEVAGTFGWTEGRLAGTAVDRVARAICRRSSAARCPTAPACSPCTRRRSPTTGSASDQRAHRRRARRAARRLRRRRRVRRSHAPTVRPSASARCARSTSAASAIRSRPISARRTSSSTPTSTGTGSSTAASRTTATR